MAQPPATKTRDRAAEERERLARNLLTFSAIVAPAFAVAKIYVVANFDLDTTLAVMQGAGAVNVAVTALVASLPALATWLLLAIPVLAYWAYEPGGGLVSRWLAVRSNIPVPMQILLGVSFLVSLFISPWPVVVLWIVMFTASLWVVPSLVARARTAILRDSAAAAARDRAAGPRSGSAAASDSASESESESESESTLRGHQGLRRMLLLGSGLLLVAALLIDPRPWMPAERLSTADGPTVGYVVSEGEWIRLLDENSRQIQILRTDQVTERVLCRIAPPARYASPFELVRGLFIRTPTGRLPRC
ncbi:MAG: hypothetical protein L0Y54_19760 [Sporichthyaceae bacterium]|nr:hypothetical protein [Sporichthyaceae bacterium]